MQAEPEDNALLRLEWQKRAPLEELEAACREHGLGLDSDAGIWSGEDYLGSIVHTPVWWVARKVEFQWHCFTASDAVFILWYWREHGC